MKMTTTEMLRKSKLDIYGLGCPHDKFIECVQAFAELVRADEREACAKVCEERINFWQRDDGRRYEDEYCADAIRARGQA